MAGTPAGAGATESPRSAQPAARRLRAIVLFVAGVLVFTDDYTVAITAFVAAPR